MADDEFSTITRFHDASAWGSYGTFPGQLPVTTAERLRVDKVERPSSCRFFADPLPGCDTILSVLRSALSRDKFGRSSTPSAGGLDTVTARLANVSSGDMYKICGGRLELATTIRPFKLRELVYHQIQGPHWLVALSANIEPCIVKYGARAYRFALMEAGHVGEALLRAASAAELAYCPLGGFNDVIFNELLISLRQFELPLYLLAIGHPGDK